MPSPVLGAEDTEGTGQRKVPAATGLALRWGDTESGGRGAEDVNDIRQGNVMWRKRAGRTSGREPRGQDAAREGPEAHCDPPCRGPGPVPARAPSKVRTPRETPLRRKVGSSQHRQETWVGQVM